MLSKGGPFVAEATARRIVWRRMPFRLVVKSRIDGAFPAGMEHRT